MKAIAILCLIPAFGMLARAEDVGTVCNVHVVSDAVEDVSSIGAWKRSFLKPGMSDQEKALAVWETVVRFRHQDGPPNEFLQGEDNVHDAIKTFNVYGYGMCCCAAANIEELGRAAGLPARGRILNAHAVPELHWDGQWRLLDASLLNYMPKADGTLAGVDEIMAGLKAWYAGHPGFKGDGTKLAQFMRGGGWRKGPEILSRCPHYDQNGWLPAATHGWYSTMQEYDGSAEGIYEYGYSQGYRVNVQLRQGERLVRNWSNKGLHVNMREGRRPGCLDGTVGKGDLRYSPDHGDLAPGRIGNGLREYEVPLAGGAFRFGALDVENLAWSGPGETGPLIHAADGGKPGRFTIRMPSSYVYLSGLLECDAVVGKGGSIAVSLSDNNGLDWKPVAEITASGSRRIDLGSFVFRRYDYRLAFVLTGGGSGLNRLKLRHDVQHSQRALPALRQGENTIAIRSGLPESTVTIEGSLDSAKRDRQLVLADFRPVLEGVNEQFLRVGGGEGRVTVPIETPGDMVRLRFGCHYRARDAKDGWDLQVSFDGGETFATVDRCGGPTPESSKYVATSAIPPGTRSALVRWSGTQRNTTCMFGLRIDADYRPAFAGFHPVKVTYEWLEAGREKRDVQVIRKPDEQHTIRCADTPVMRSVAIGWAD